MNRTGIVQPSISEVFGKRISQICRSSIDTKLVEASRAFVYYYSVLVGGSSAVALLQASWPPNQNIAGLDVSYVEGEGIYASVHAFCRLRDSTCASPPQFELLVF